MSTRINLDLDTLRTLSVAQEAGSLAQAAERLGRTPSAISLQMKRLQDDLGTPVFRKRGRGLVLTEAGVVALTYARRILTLNDELLANLQGAKMAGQMRIGSPQDFALILPSILSHFSSLYPRMQIELRIEGNAALADAVETSQIDIAMVIGQEHRATAQTICELDLVWIASTNFIPPRNQVLPLATLGPQCVFRKRALELLETEKIPHRIAASSPSLDGLWAALLGGLGITARTSLNLPPGLASANSLFRLPSLGKMPVTVHRNPRAGSLPVDLMATLLSESLRSALSPRQKAKSLPPSRKGVSGLPNGKRAKA